MTTYAGCALQDVIPFSIAPVNAANSSPRKVLLVAIGIRFSASPVSTRAFWTNNSF